MFANSALPLAISSVCNLVGRFKIEPNLVANEPVAVSTQKSYAAASKNCQITHAFVFWIQHGGAAVNLFRFARTICIPSQ